MTLEIQQAAARRMRRLVLGLVALVVVLAAAVVALVVTGDSGPSSAAPGPSSVPGGTASAPPSPLPTETAEGGYVAPEKWVVLPKGRGEEDGLPVKFEHTPEGAAAAAVEAVRHGWTWDADAAERAAAVYSVPSEADDLKKAAREATAASRLSAGVPGTGELPEGARMSVFPLGVQWTAEGPDKVTVSVLARIVYRSGADSDETTQLSAATNTMVWTDGDWHSKTGAAQSAPEPHDVGTAGFNDAGWSAIQEGDTR
ncbi:hypothetical protein [Streptomyces atacamensis]|uniref:hypothetical protein n=1 Tax=Streptomyces atacamensis TaxID=531966 RepID=UPI00399C722E